MPRAAKDAKAIRQSKQTHVLLQIIAPRQHLGGGLLTVAVWVTTQLALHRRRNGGFGCIVSRRALSADPEPRPDIPCSAGTLHTVEPMAGPPWRSASPTSEAILATAPFLTVSEREAVGVFEERRPPCKMLRDNSTPCLPSSAIKQTRLCLAVRQNLHN